MLNGRIMHECIQKLLRETDEESLECMCRLITTIGQVHPHHLLTYTSSLHIGCESCVRAPPLAHMHKQMPEQMHRKTNC